MAVQTTTLQSGKDNLRGLNTNAREPMWLTATEAAAYLKVEPRTLLAWARAGKVRGYILSGIKRITWRFRQLDLDATLITPAVLNDGRTK